MKRKRKIDPRGGGGGCARTLRDSASEVLYVLEIPLTPLDQFFEPILEIEEDMVFKKSRRQVGQIHLQLNRQFMYEYVAGFRNVTPRNPR